MIAAELRRVRAVAWKDLTTEQRTRTNLNAVFFFAIVVLLLFGFALGPEAAALRAAGAGILWLTILFSGVLVFNRSFQVETADGALDALLLYPGDRRSLFLGKLLGNLTFVMLVVALMVPISAVLFHLPVARTLPALAAVLALGAFGFVTLGTFYAALTSRLRAREVLLPLLLFPMLVPLLVAAAAATDAVLAGDPMGTAGGWLRLLLAFDVIFFLAALFTFEHVIEE